MSIELTNFDWKTQYDGDEGFKEAIDSLCKGILSNLPEWADKIKFKSSPLRDMPLLDDIPMVCKGNECPFAAKCKVLKGITDPKELLSLIGTDCRVEQVLIPKLFLDYLHMLQIKPSDIGDILEVSNLISLIVQRRRIEMDIAIHSINERMIVGMQQGKPIIQRTNNPSFKLLESVNKQITVIEGQLATSRKDRMNMENRNADKLADWLSSLAQVKAQNAKKTLSLDETNNLLGD